MISDVDFFTANPTRQARLRKPVLQPVKDNQRAVRYQDEFAREFWQLGSHKRDRRRVVVLKTEHQGKQTLLPIPFLLNDGEVLEDTDDVLLPLVAEIMSAARV